MIVDNPAGAIVFLVTNGDTGVIGRSDLHLGKNILIFSHDMVPSQYQTGSSSHQFHHSGQPRVQNGPLMTMHTALQNAAEIATNTPTR